ncbi:MAG: hypothetical protein AAFN78_16735 [Pseudomonadota bacterium]
MKSQRLYLAVLVLPLAACGGGGGGDPVSPPVQVNQAPSVAVPADQVLVANDAGKAIAFTVSDETPGSVSVTATADDQLLVATGDVTSDGSGRERTLVVTPGEDRAGATVITVTATDSAGLSAQVRFAVTVNPEQRSMQEFARSEFPAGADGAPSLINAVEFLRDAEDDDFADLLL